MLHGIQEEEIPEISEIFPLLGFIQMLVAMLMKFISTQFISRMGGGSIRIFTMIFCWEWQSLNSRNISSLVLRINRESVARSLSVHRNLLKHHHGQAKGTQWRPEIANSECSQRWFWLQGNIQALWGSCSYCPEHHQKVQDFQQSREPSKTRTKAQSLAKASKIFSSSCCYQP